MSFLIFKAPKHVIKHLSLSNHPYHKQVLTCDLHFVLELDSSRQPTAVVVVVICTVLFNKDFKFIDILSQSCRIMFTKGKFQY